VAMSAEVEGPLARADDEALSSPTLWRNIPQANLAGNDYVVEEFLLNATGRLFADAHGALPPTLRADGVAYTTRVLVMRPADPARFSGVALLEAYPGYPTGDDDYNVVWSEAAQHVMRRGHVVVAVTCKRLGAETLRSYDAERYQRIRIDDDGLMWDILGEVAAALRGDGGSGLLPGFGPTRTLLAAGLSQSATILRTYLGERMPELHSAERGHPIIDGFIIDVSSGGWGPAGYLGVAQNHDHVFDAEMRSVTDEAVALDDPRRSIRRPPVPVIEFMSEDEAVQHQWHHRPDSDVHGDRYRCYQLVGRGHMSGLRTTTLYGSPQNIVVRNGYPRDSYEPWEDGEQFPHHATRFLWAAMIDNLVAWIESDVPAPRADPILIDIPAGYQRDPRGVDYSRLTPRKDSNGNGIGGVRYLDVEVPTGRMHKVADARPVGIGTWQYEPFDRERLDELHGDEAAYRARVVETVARLVAQRWYLAEDAAEAIDLAMARYRDIAEARA
jgi:hypothetical protein